MEMNRERFKEWKKKNPYHVWIHDDKTGRKFIAHYKDRKEAVQYTGKGYSVGKETTAAKTTRKRRRPSNSYFGGGGFGFPKFRF